MNPKSIGVPLEGKVRVQLNLKVEQALHIETVKNFRDFVFPIMWVEEVSPRNLFGTQINDSNDFPK